MDRCKSETRGSVSTEHATYAAGPLRYVSMGRQSEANAEKVFQILFVLELLIYILLSSTLKKSLDGCGTLGVDDFGDLDGQFSAAVGGVFADPISRGQTSFTMGFQNQISICRTVMFVVKY